MFKLLLLFIIIFILYIFEKYKVLDYLQINIYPKLNYETYKEKIRVNKKNKVIISLTTLPKRIEKCKYTIVSILNQTRKVDQINLYIPTETKKGEKYIIPLWMKDLQKNFNIFNIKIVEKDYGPSTKIIPALIEYEKKDIFIIYLDDDMIYHPEAVETLIFYSNIYSNCAICNSGSRLKKNKYIDILEGFGGVLVKPVFFQNINLEKILEFPDFLYYNDDIFI